MSILHAIGGKHVVEDLNKLFALGRVQVFENIQEHADVILTQSRLQNTASSIVLFRRGSFVSMTRDTDHLLSIKCILDVFTALPKLGEMEITKLLCSNVLIEVILLASFTVSKVR